MICIAVFVRSRAALLRPDTQRERERERERERARAARLLIKARAQARDTKLKYIRHARARVSAGIPAVIL